MMMIIMMWGGKQAVQGEEEEEEEEEEEGQTPSCLGAGRREVKVQHLCDISQQREAECESLSDRKLRK